MFSLSKINQIFSQIESKTEKIDKIIIYILVFFPFSLAASIFIADLFCVIVSIVLIYSIIDSNNRNYFKQIKQYILIFSLLYGIILISFYLSEFKNKSFLPSFFLLSIFFVIFMYLLFT